MVGLAVITKDEKVFDIIVKLIKPFKWINCNRFNSLNDLIRNNYSLYKIVVFDFYALDKDWEIDEYSLTEKIHLVSKNAKSVFLVKQLLSYNNLKSIMMKIFHLSLGYRPISN